MFKRFSLRIPLLNRARSNESYSAKPGRKNLHKLSNGNRFRLPGFVTKIFANRDINRRLVGTLVVILIYRVLAAVPLPGIDVAKFQQSFGSASYSDTNYLFSLFTGGSLHSPSLVGMGIAAYINASIIIQLMTTVIPYLERMSKEGERGREIINRYTRFLTLPLAVFYSLGYVVFLRNIDENTEIGKQIAASGVKAIFAQLSVNQIVLVVVALTAGTMLLMWLAELLTEVGIGNGMSIFISMNIATTLPALLQRDFQTYNLPDLFTRLFQNGDSSVLSSISFSYVVMAVLGTLLIFVAIIFITESTRKVPIQYARRVRENANTESSYLPLKLNQSGVVPVIFASSFLTMPQIVIPLLVNWGNSMPDGAALKSFLVSLNGSFLLAGYNSATYVIVDVVLILLFAFFYSIVVIKPENMAENLQKSGAFIPGIRPGKATQTYITNVMLRLTTVGGSFLALVAIIPVIAGNLLTNEVSLKPALFSGIGGTSLIIIVGTALETYRQVQSYRVSKSYERYI